MHFICDCSFYNSDTVKLFDYIRNATPNFASLNSFDTVIWLMTCQNNDIIKINMLNVCTRFTLHETG